LKYARIIKGNAGKGSKEAVNIRIKSRRREGLECILRNGKQTITLEKYPGIWIERMLV
jgi:hypothetical protein